jgi:catechol 2,3-dioxygenase-like lactoylglutathione lyase family enzyme
MTPTVRRIVANLAVDDPAADAPFWTGLLGLETPMDMGWIVNHSSVDHSTGAAQVQLISRDATAPEDSRVSVEVADLATLQSVHDGAVAAGYEIVHPLTDEPWGVRRFFVRTPQGVVVNVLAHR